MMMILATFWTKLKMLRKCLRCQLSMRMTISQVRLWISSLKIFLFPSLYSHHCLSPNPRRVGSEGREGGAALWHQPTWPHRPGVPCPLVQGLGRQAPLQLWPQVSYVTSYTLCYLRAPRTAAWAPHPRWRVLHRRHQHLEGCHHLFWFAGREAPLESGKSESNNANSRVIILMLLLLKRKIITGYHLSPL